MTAEEKVPLRARLPWFAVWVPVALLLYTLVNGAGHVLVAYHQDPNKEVSQETCIVLFLATFPCGPWGFLIYPVLVIFAFVSWRLCPQWSAMVRWMAGMLGALFCTLFLFAQSALLCYGGWRNGMPFNLKVCVVQLWRPHFCRPVLQWFNQKSPAWQAQASDVAGLLGHEDPALRIFAADTLDELGRREYVPDIAALLKDRDAVVRQTAAWTLYSFDAKEYVPGIAALLRDGDSRARHSAVEALGGLGSKEYVPEIAALLKDEDRMVCYRAVEALGKLGAQEYASNIAPFLKNADAEDRRMAATVLGKLGAKEQAQDIAALLKDPDVMVRRAAISALKELKVEACAPSIVALSKDGDFEVRRLAVWALYYLGPRHAPDIAVFLQDESVKWDASDALRRLASAPCP